MQKTLTISIGNSDDRLSQVRWSHFILALREIVDPDKATHQYGWSHVEFFGFTAPDSLRQSCTAVVAVDTVEILQLFNVSFEQWLEYTVRPALSRICAIYHQDSIALTIGVTEFVGVRS